MLLATNPAMLWATDHGLYGQTMHFPAGCFIEGGEVLRRLKPDPRTAPFDVSV